MAVSETAVASAPVQLTNAPLPADPWDAPYFGGPVYLAYQPAPLPAMPALPASAAAMLTPATKSAGLLADPWDAPYFGAPVYFRYPDYPVAVAAPGIPDVIANPGESTRNDTAIEVDAVEIVEVVEAAPARTGRRGGWLARLFGR